MFSFKNLLIGLCIFTATPCYAFDFSPFTTCTGPYACLLSNYLGIQFPDGTHQTTAAASSSTIDQISGEYEIAYNRTYTLSLAIPYSGSINTLKIQTASGTATVAIQINGVNVTGMSAVSVSSVLATATATAAKTFSANDKITLIVSSANLANDLVFTLKLTKN